jgi:hypothetical protein
MGSRGREQRGCEMSDLRADTVDEIPLGELLRQRSMLVILVDASMTALSAFAAADNAIDTDLRTDLSKLSERSEAALAKLSRKIDESS